MSQKLTGTTIVVNPATATAEVLLEGSTLPSWAEGLVGDHLLTGRPTSTGNVPETETNPFAKMTKADLKAYAAEHGIDLGAASKVDEMRAAIAAAEDARKAAPDAEPTEGDGSEGDGSDQSGSDESNDSDDESKGDAAGADEN